jgi:hypothetical protein
MTEVVAIEFLCKYDEDIICIIPYKCWQCDLGKYYKDKQDTEKNQLSETSPESS